MLYIPPEMRKALEEQRRQDGEGRSIDQRAHEFVIAFLKENLTEERSDVVIEAVKKVAQERVPRLLRPVISLAFSVADRFMPEALINGIDAGLRAARLRFGAQR